MPKESEGKPKVNLVYYSLMREIAKVREYGIKKYGGRAEWRDVPTEDYFDAAIRHLVKAKAAMFDEESIFTEVDEESGLLHLAHAASDIMFLIERYYYKEK